jgi:hypothetical protein
MMTCTTSGHSICNTCYIDLKTQGCPICREPLPSKPCRNMSLEQVIAQLQSGIPISCYNGCGAKIPYESFIEHQKTCSNKKFVCPLCPQTCDGMEALADHLVLHHNTTIMSTRDTRFELTDSHISFEFVDDALAGLMRHIDTWDDTLQRNLDGFCKAKHFLVYPSKCEYALITLVKRTAVIDNGAVHRGLIRLPQLMIEVRSLTQDSRSCRVNWSWTGTTNENEDNERERPTVKVREDGEMWNTNDRNHPEFSSNSNTVETLFPFFAWDLHGKVSNRYAPYKSITRSGKLHFTCYFGYSCFSQQKT